jgi:SPOR domain/AMIN domain
MIKFLLLILLVLVDLPHPVSAETTASYAIQVDVFKDLQKAKKRTEFLKTMGLDAFWKEERPGGKARRYVVYIGTYDSRGEARKEAKRLRQEGVLVDYFIKTFDSADQERPPQERKEPVPTEMEPGLVISEIVFKLKTPGKEAVWIQGNRPFTPSAFAIEEDNPRFVIDIKDTGPVKRELSQIAADGQFIEKIRTFYHRENRTLRVVLDLQPSKSYQISQFFYQAQNLYAVEVEGE